MTPEIAALDRLMRTMGSAIAEYEASLSAQERVAYERCDCLLCLGTRDIRKAVEMYEEQQGLGMARTVLLQVLGRRG